MLHSLYTPKSPFDTSLPNLVISVDNDKVIGVAWYDDTHQALEFVQCFSLSCRECVLIFQVQKQLDEYFAGSRTVFELPLAFGVGTAFEQAVWGELANIDYGATISYKELATRLGKPTAYRAVANANGKNPLSLIIPCHRVITSSGAIGGYTGGVGIKEVLLRHEQASFGKN